MSSYLFCFCKFRAKIFWDIHRNVHSNQPPFWFFFSNFMLFVLIFKFRAKRPKGNTAGWLIVFKENLEIFPKSWFR